MGEIDAYSISIQCGEVCSHRTIVGSNAFENSAEQVSEKLFESSESLLNSVSGLRVHLEDEILVRLFFQHSQDNRFWILEVVNYRVCFPVIALLSGFNFEIV